MDRDLAIKVINRMIKTGIAYDDGYAYEPLTNDEKEALDMAIKALEEPCEDMARKIKKEYLFESLCEDLKKLQAENENLRSALGQELKTKSLGEELRSVRNGIKDENVLIGYNMAVAICNKYLSDKEEQELVLDKIRAEIRKLDDINPDYSMDRTIHIDRDEVLEIIDKYKAESEG